MLELMYATGVRVSELIALNVEDVNLPAAFLRCGDEKRERIIPLYPRAVKALRDYIQVIRPRLADQEEAGAVCQHERPAHDPARASGSW